MYTCFCFSGMHDFYNVWRHSLKNKSGPIRIRKFLITDWGIGCLMVRFLKLWGMALILICMWNGVVLIKRNTVFLKFMSFVPMMIFQQFLNFVNLRLLITWSCGSWYFTKSIIFSQIPIIHLNHISILQNYKIYLWYLFINSCS